MIRARDSAQRVLAGVKARNASNVLKTILDVKVRDASALRTVFTSFGGSAGLTVTPELAYGYGYSKGSITISTNSVTVTVSGGVAPYTFAWTGASGAWTIINPTSDTTAFRRSSVGAGTNDSRTFTCTVTDANGATSSITVDAYVENSY